MAKPSKPKLVRALLDLHGKTFSEELKIRLQTNSPSALFQWLIASILFSTRISSGIATKAAQALFDKGWTTPQKLAQTTWRQRTVTLNRSGYARYDESTSTRLGFNMDLLLEKYKGDLRKLREEAERDPEKERKLLKKFKNMGDVGVDIFFREAQVVWDELYPFADKKAIAAAQRLGLGRNPKELAALVPQKDFLRLTAALVRTDLCNAYDRVREEAAKG